MQTNIVKSSLLSKYIIVTLHVAHYSKSQIFVQKFNFDRTPTFSRVFHPNFFLTIFLVKSKLSTAKKYKTTTFSRVFHQKKIDNFLGKSKLNFWTKNEDFEQCDVRNGNIENILRTSTSKARISTSQPNICVRLGSVRPKSPFHQDEALRTFV